jgi:hypothetical protein
MTDLQTIIVPQDDSNLTMLSRLCNMKVTTIQTKIDLSKVGTRFNDFKEKELSRAINTDDRNDIIVKSWQKYAGTLFQSN